MIVLDASVLIAHLNPLDVHHDGATQILLGPASREVLIIRTMTMAEVLGGGVRIGRGAQLHADLRAAGIELAIYDQEEPRPLAELRARSGLKLPDCCVLDAAINNSAALATFDDALATAARQRGVPVLPSV